MTLYILHTAFECETLFSEANETHVLRAGIQILFSPAQVGSRERCGCCRPVPPPPPSFLLLTEPRAASGRQRCGPCPCAAPVSGSRPESGWPGGRDANSLLPSAKTEVAFVLRRLTGLWGPGLALSPRVTSRAGRGAWGPPTCTSRDAAAVGGAHRGRGARRGRDGMASRAATAGRQGNEARARLTLPKAGLAAAGGGP